MISSFIMYCWCWFDQINRGFIYSVVLMCQLIQHALSIQYLPIWIELEVELLLRLTCASAVIYSIELLLIGPDLTQCFLDVRMIRCTTPFFIDSLSPFTCSTARPSQNILGHRPNCHLYTTRRSCSKTMDTMATHWTWAHEHGTANIGSKYRKKIRIGAVSFFTIFCIVCLEKHGCNHS